MQKVIKTDCKRKLINSRTVINGYMEKQLEKEVFSDAQYKTHIDHVAREVGVDKETVDFVIRHFFTSVAYGLCIRTREFMRFVFPAALDIHKFPIGRSKTQKHYKYYATSSASNDRESEHRSGET